MGLKSRFHRLTCSSSWPKYLIRSWRPLTDTSPLGILPPGRSALKRFDTHFERFAQRGRYYGLTGKLFGNEREVNAVLCVR